MTVFLPSFLLSNCHFILNALTLILWGEKVLLSFLFQTHPQFLIDRHTRRKLLSITKSKHQLNLDEFIEIEISISRTTTRSAAS